jgi:hypothetical protein
MDKPQRLTNSQALLMPTRLRQTRLVLVQDSYIGDINLSHHAVRHGRKTPATLATSCLRDLRKSNPAILDMNFLRQIAFGSRHVYMAPQRPIPGDASAGKSKGWARGYAALVLAWSGPHCGASNVGAGSKEMAKVACPSCALSRHVASDSSPHLWMTSLHCLRGGWPAMLRGGWPAIWPLEDPAMPAKCRIGQIYAGGVLALPIARPMSGPISWPTRSVHVSPHHRTQSGPIRPTPGPGAGCDITEWIWAALGSGQRKSVADSSRLGRER